MAAIGADGLTNEQWLSSRGNSEIEKEFRNENREDEKDKDKKGVNKKIIRLILHVVELDTMQNPVQFGIN